MISDVLLWFYGLDFKSQHISAETRVFLNLIPTGAHFGVRLVIEPKS